MYISPLVASKKNEMENLEKKLKSNKSDNRKEGKKRLKTKKRQNLMEMCIVQGIIITLRKQKHLRLITRFLNLIS